MTAMPKRSSLSGAMPVIICISCMALAACGTRPKAVVERACPLEIEPPDCPDFPLRAGKPWEVVLDERDLTYARCRGWTRTFWKARQDCAPPAR